LVGTSHAQVQIGGQDYSIPRYLYVGRQGGGDLQRIGIFATLHGDEPEGVLALGKFLQTLEERPESPRATRCSSIRCAIPPALKTALAIPAPGWI
jgi:hypothetical protein